MPCSRHREHPRAECWSVFCGVTWGCCVPPSPILHYKEDNRNATRPVAKSHHITLSLLLQTYNCISAPWTATQELTHLKYEWKINTNITIVNAHWGITYACLNSFSCWRRKLQHTATNEGCSCLTKDVAARWRMRPPNEGCASSDRRICTHCPMASPSLYTAES